LRTLFEKIVEKRRKCSQDELNSRADLLSILHTDDLFKDNNKLIIDECLTFFFAGSQTSSIPTQNIVMYLMRKSQIM
jgi:cytochrome P450